MSRRTIWGFRATFREPIWYILRGPVFWRAHYLVELSLRCTPGGMYREFGQYSLPNEPSWSSRVRSATPNSTTRDVRMDQRMTYNERNRTSSCRRVVGLAERVGNHYSTSRPPDLSGMYLQPCLSRACHHHHLVRMIETFSRNLVTHPTGRAKSDAGSYSSTVATVHRRDHRCPSLSAKRPSRGRDRIDQPAGFANERSFAFAAEKLQDLQRTSLPTSTSSSISDQSLAFGRTASSYVVSWLILTLDSHR
nr:hypothetical protein CFP56_30787 [Quercus suber]